MSDMERGAKQNRYSEQWSGTGMGYYIHTKKKCEVNSKFLVLLNREVDRLDSPKL